MTDKQRPQPVLLENGDVLVPEQAGDEWTTRRVVAGDDGHEAWVAHLTGRPAPAGSLVPAGYITAVLLPIVGFFVGLVLLIKNRPSHGIAVMVISVVVGTLAVAYFASSGGDTSYADCISGLPVEQWDQCD